MNNFLQSKEYRAGEYDKCLKCPFLGDGCDGPRTSSMSIERWWMWCRALKELRGLTVDEIAASSGVSRSTIQRIMGGKVSSDIQRFTAGALEDVLIGSSGKFPCAMEMEAQLPELQKELDERELECSRLRATLEGIHGSYRSEIKQIREDAQKKIDFLREENARKDAIIAKLLDR